MRVLIAEDEALIRMDLREMLEEDGHEVVLVTPHATDPTMIEARPSPVDRVDVPASLTTLIEFATGRAGIPAQGFAVHIPHYLVNTEYPTGAITVLDELAKAAELVIDHGDLPQLAARRLSAAGLDAIAVDGRCTFADRERFFSHRRDGQCGRMAALVWMAA